MEPTVVKKKSKCWKLVLRVLLVGLLVVLGVSEGGSEAGRRLSSRVVTLVKYGSLKGFIVSPAGRQMQPVDVFLGVPYASPPIGSLRFMPPLTPSPWRGIRVADHFGPVCPQKYPDISNETAAIRRMPRGRIQYLKRLIPYLRNQSEDCLYLNIYSPARVGRDLARLPVMVYVHGESFEWNSGNPYDGTILASFGDVVVVTLNFRLGVFGFLMVAGEAIRANFGLLDQIAALHWIKENIEEFGGDYNNVTIFGHGYGAACINFLMISPLAVGLFHRAILMSGSALSPWASVQDPIQYSRQVTAAVGCKEDAEDMESLSCLKKCSEQELLRVDIRAPDYLSAFGPIVDGIVIKDRPERLMNSEGVSFNRYDLLFGTTRVETLLPFNADDIQFGVDPERRDKILRTFLSNTRSFHLNELLALLVNEYTDWTKTTQHPINTRDATMEILGDGFVVAPLVQTGNYHASFEVMPRATTYAYNFGYQSRYGDYPHRLGCIHGEELAFVFGAPLIGGLGHFHRNYSKSERILSEAVITYWANFAKSGDPNVPERQPNLEATTAVTAGRNKNRFSKTQWPPYDIPHEKYLTIGMRPKQRHHYRAHKLSIWLRLIPALHRQDATNTLPAHHLLYRHDDPNLFTGTVRDAALLREGLSNAAVPSTPPDMPWYPRINSTQTRPHPSDGPVNGGGARHPYYMSTPPSSESRPMPSEPGADGVARNVTDTLRAEAIAHGSYSTALSVTIAVGCSLLILNVLIFAGVYYQRDKNRLEAKLHKKNYHMKKVNEEAAAASAIPMGPTLPTTPKKLPHSPQTTTAVNTFPSSGGQGGQVAYTPRAPPPSPVGQSSRTLLQRGEALPDLPNAIIVAQTLNATKAPPPKVPPKPQSSTTPGGHDLNALTEVQPLLGQGLGTLGMSRQQHKSPKMQEIRV